MPKYKITDIARLVRATRYSWQGLYSAWQTETSFRQEVMVIAVLVIVALMLDASPTQRALLIFVCLQVLIVELFNSAIEAVVDRIGPENHPLSGRAKNMGSAAVLISLIAGGAVWVLVLWDIFS